MQINHLVKKVHFCYSAGLAQASSNPLNIYLDNITLGTSQLISNSIIINSNKGFFNLSIPSGFVVNKDNAITLRIVTPVFGNSPTNVNFWCEFTIE